MYLSVVYNSLQEADLRCSYIYGFRPIDLVTNAHTGTVNIYAYPPLSVHHGYCC